MKKNMLILTHNFGGGTESFLNYYMSIFNSYNFYILRPENVDDNLVYVFTSIQTGKKSGYIYSKLLSEIDLIEKVKELKIDEIFINHLIQFDIGLMVRFILGTELPFTFFMHDYSCVCHNYKLICEQKYCKDLKNPICNEYFSGGADINLYQHVWHTLLKKAELIVAPSNCAAEVFKKNYPDIPVQVKPHKILLPLLYTFDECNVKQEKINIVFPGIIPKEKGLDYIIKMDSYIYEKNLPINLIVLGNIYPENIKYQLKNVKITGRYEAAKISFLLKELKTSLVAVLSTWKETYCYTASEAILSGYPVLSFDIGAHSERIEKHNCGWILPLGYDNSLYDWLEYIVTEHGRDSIIKKSKNTRLFVNGT